MTQQISKADLASAQALVMPEMKRVGPDLELTQSLIGTFASATRDFNPRHVGAEAIVSGKAIAHGLHGAALIPYLASDLRPFDLFSDAQCMLHEVRSIKFGRPIRVGSTVYALGRIAEVVRQGSGILITFEWKVMYGTNTTASSGTYILLYH